MRMLIILLMCTTVAAEEMSTPQLMRKEVIDGKVYECKPDGPKKKRVAKKKKPPAPPVVITKEVVREVEVIKEVDNSYKNTVKLMAGIGPGYSNTFRTGNTVTLENKLGLVPGIGYERQLDRLWSVEGFILFNRSVILDVGYSF